jgi:2-succinyl-5-enolpyruvyl-6-hydroxy-3-cyclohexene-1-carboxylate synthase
MKLADYRRLTTAELNQLWGAAIVDALAKSDCVRFVISPGSRSTPITLAAARDPRLHCKIILDERAAAYYALGVARALRKPVVLVCTSGTAVANYFPAVVEASVDNVPLIILTADRPPELRETGANQTIDQVRIFGHYPRWFFDFPAPTEDINLNFIYSTIGHAVFSAIKFPGGPVHLNCMFREPFIPQQPVELELKDRQPPKYCCEQTGISNSVAENFLKAYQNAKQPLIVAGRGISTEQQRAIINFAEKFDIPVFADIAGGLRLHGHSDVVVHYFDQLLLSEKFKAKFQPDFILYFGATAVSKRLLLWLDELSIEKYWHIGMYSQRQNPLHKVTDAIFADITAFCDRISKIEVDRSPARQNLSVLQQLNRLIDGEIDAVLTEWGETISEISLARLLSRNIRKNYTLFLSSSMPIRDMDMYAAAPGNPILVNCNRGASGIDGIIATACGVAAGSDKGIVTMIGDIALLHDLNSLLLIRDAAQPHIVVAINNGGGGIFSFLPVVSQKDVFEQFFATPHGLSFRYAAELFGLAYASPQNNAEFVSTFQKWQTDNTKGIIEIKTERAANLDLHRQIQNRLMKIVDNSI